MICYKIIWSLWEYRNHQIFKLVFISPFNGDEQIKSLIYLWIKCRGRVVFVHGMNGHRFHFNSLSILFFISLTFSFTLFFAICMLYFPWSLAFYFSLAEQFPLPCFCYLYALLSLVPR